MRLPSSILAVIEISTPGFARHSTVPGASLKLRQRYNGASAPLKELIMSNENRIEIEAAAFRRLLQHLNVERNDVQNIDLMILAGFCRNCLADWYREAAAERGLELSKDAARDRIYGEPYANWKAKYGKEATEEQLFALALAETRHPRE
jgi:hypothetical protein